MNTEPRTSAPIDPRSQTGSYRGGNRSVPLPAALAITVLLDLGIMFTGASLLWKFAGSTVVSGPVYGHILFVIANCLLMAIRLKLTTTSRRGERSLQQHFAPSAAVMLTHFILLTLLIAAWKMSNNYMFGWFACYASVLLAVGALWQIMGILATEQSFPMICLLSTGFGAGIIGLFITTPIHQWGSSIVEIVAVLLTTAILISTMVDYWAKALWSRWNTALA